MVDCIEISSSPEPSGSRSASTKPSSSAAARLRRRDKASNARPKRKTRASRQEEVIELTDSDDDRPVAQNTRAGARVAREAVGDAAGPSKLHGGKDRTDLQAGTSQTVPDGDSFDRLIQYFETPPAPPKYNGKGKNKVTENTEAVLAVAPSSSNTPGGPGGAPEPTKQSRSRSPLPLFLPSDEDVANLSDSVFDQLQLPPDTRASSPVPDIDMAAPPPDVHMPAPPATSDPTHDFTRDIDTNPGLQQFIDPLFRVHAQISSIIPDVDPAHVRSLVQAFAEALPHATPDQLVEQVLHRLFEDPSYPKVDKHGKGKRKREEGDVEESLKRGAPKSKLDVDYGKTDRLHEVGAYYYELALAQLVEDFPSIPYDHIFTTFQTRNNFYAPAFLQLHAEMQQGPPFPFEPKAVGGENAADGNSKGKGKERLLTDEAFERERRWVKEKLGKDSTTAVMDRVVDRDTAEVLQTDEATIECQCCFTDYPFTQMIQCPDAHLFCKECMTTYSSTLLGAHDCNIVCMEQGGCKLAFTESELRRFLTPKLLELYERVRQRKEIEAAGLDNLEECPFCEYKVVIDNPEEKLFRCEREECGAVSCRGCKKLDHLPKSCKEVEEDKKLDAQHHVEEAMTKALMRNCPKCTKPFIKEGGCNKMSCPNCRTLSCYICRQIINGYDHFHERGNTKGQCTLWDPNQNVELRHNQEVTQAAKKALEDYKRANPETDTAAIKVDMPPAPAAGTSAPVPGRPAYPHGMVGIMAGMPPHHQMQAHLAYDQFLAARPHAGHAEAVQRQREVHQIAMQARVQQVQQVQQMRAQLRAGREQALRAEEEHARRLHEQALLLQLHAAQAVRPAPHAQRAPAVHGGAHVDAGQETFRAAMRAGLPVGGAGPHAVPAGAHGVRMYDGPFLRGQVAPRPAMAPLPVPARMPGMYGPEPARVPGPFGVQHNQVPYGP